MRTEVTIDEGRCNGCGYCTHFCPAKCLDWGLDRISRLGYPVPTLAKPEKCTACGACERMCPRWAVEVIPYFEEDETVVKEKVAGSTIDPPLSGCPGCQHPTVGRIILEAIDEIGLGDDVIALDGIPCTISSAFGMNFGRKLIYDEAAPDLATLIKRVSPDVPVIAVQGYWGLSDFSLDISALIGALIRGENITIAMCNMPFYGPKDGRPAPVNEPAEGLMDPITRISSPEGEKLMVGGYPLRMAELIASFDGVAYSARGDISSMKAYQRTKNYVKKALQKQLNSPGLSFVEILCVCSDPTYSSPVESLRWVEDKMTTQFPLGEFKE